MRKHATGYGIAATALPAIAQAQSAPVVDYSHWGVNSVVVAATAAVVCLSVVVHYEALALLSSWLGRRPGQRRHRVLFAIFGTLSAHVVEIWIFGVATTLLLLWPRCGSTFGMGSDILDQVYLSAMTFTTVGATDAHIVGPIRFLNGMEAVTGLVLITWSASFTFLQMERFWRER